MRTTRKLAVAAFMPLSAVLAAVAVALSLSALSAPPAAAEDAAPLGSYTIDPEAVSVSGISSGGFMAVQLHVAFSARYMGAGVVAGGPYYCAQGNVLRATSICMSALPVPPDPSLLASITRVVADSGDIDNPANMAEDRVYLFTGLQDTVVHKPVMTALRTYYGQNFVDQDNMEFVDTIDAPHSFVTDNDGSQECHQRCSPILDECIPNQCEPNDLCSFVNDCDYDTAEAILSHIYGELQPKTDAVAANLLTFEQAAFVRGGDPGAYSMAETGHVYVPTACQSGETHCRLHVALHGCLQSSNRIGDAFFSGAGYNAWAEANDIVVLYPQVVRSELIPFNPQGCWDWWGYSGVYYYRQQGPQMAAIDAMVDRLMGVDGGE